MVFSVCHVLPFLCARVLCCTLDYTSRPECPRSMKVVLRVLFITELSVDLLSIAASDVCQAESVASSPQYATTAAIIGGAVAVVLIIVVTIIVILIALKSRRRTSNIR